MIDSMAREDAKPSIFLIAGSRDFLSLRQDTEQLSERLDRAGFSIRYRTLDGGHDWQLWADALPDALMFLGDALRAR
jgi:enterochelin esterase-like enzyme